MVQPLFTAARIASALGLDKRGVLRMLKRIPAQGKALVPGGQLADVWSVESLPANYRADLDRLSKLRGCRNAEHFLAEGLGRWKCPIPMAELGEHHIARAVRVKNALARALTLYGNSAVNIGEIRHCAWRDYQKEMGVVSERTVRRVFDRAVTRDAGEENFDDVSLYLDDRLSRLKGTEAILPGFLNPHEQAVFRYLSSVQRSTEPTVEEMNVIWFAACEAMHAQVQVGKQERVCRRAMVAFLTRSAVTLSKTKEALKILLKRKYSRYVACGGDFDSMSDKRGENSGWKRALVLDEESRRLIVGHAAQNRGGRLAPALRELREDGKLGTDLEMHHLSNPASKSYVPASLRAQVQPDIRRLKNMVHGPRTHRLLGAHITRDYSNAAAGDWYQADDVTLPVYYYEETGKGIERMRGQFLVMIDVRTDFVLGFLLISSRNYNALAIRSLITICASKHGLPRKGFSFERGIWKSSKIIAGSRDAVPYSHFDTGVKRLGMELRHAQLPRGKVIERTIGQLQNRMEGFPGYVGRDERHDVRERVQRQFLDVDAGRGPINESLWSKSRYCEELAKIIEDHNTEPQQGRLAGMSPQDAWETLQGSEPRQGFSHEWRYVLARDVRKIKVGRNGITIRYGKKPFVYHDAQTGKRVGEDILAWFDPMQPEVLVCTDLDNKNLFSVERANDVPAMDASPEQLREATEKIQAHQAYAQTLYWTAKNTLKDHHYIPTLADDATLKMGSDIASQGERIKVKNEELKKRGRLNRSLIETKQLPRELLEIADTTSPDTLNALGRLLSETEAEERL